MKNSKPHRTRTPNEMSHLVSVNLELTKKLQLHTTLANDSPQERIS